jgi:histidinol-phosphatase (PHP family)
MREDAFPIRDLAGSGRALEQIGSPIRPWIPRSCEARTVARITFASDAHTTDALAGNCYEAIAMAEHFGFRQGRHTEDFWTR